jgi:hypothetical protein
MINTRNTKNNTKILKIQIKMLIIKIVTALILGVAALDYLIPRKKKFLNMFNVKTRKK